MSGVQRCATEVRKIRGWWWQRWAEAAAAYAFERGWLRRCGDGAGAEEQQQQAAQADAAAGSRELSRDINTESICYRP